MKTEKFGTILTIICSSDENVMYNETKAWVDLDISF